MTWKDDGSCDTAIEDAIRFLPLRDSSSVGRQYAKEEVRRILRVVNGVITLNEYPKLAHERLDRLVGHITRLNGELSQLTYPDKVFWQLHRQNILERENDPNLPLTDELFSTLKTYLSHLEKLGRTERDNVEKYRKSKYSRKLWTYWLAIECHTAFMLLCDKRPTSSSNSAFTNFVRKVHECAGGEPSKTLHEEIRTAISGKMRKFGKIAG